MNLGTHEINRLRLRWMYVAADVLASVLVWVSFLAFRWVVNDGRTFSYGEVLVPAFNFYTPLFMYPLACFMVHYLSGSYVHPENKSILRGLGQVLLSAAVISFVFFFLIMIDDVVVSYQRYYYSLGALFVLQFSITFLFRLGIGLYWHKKKTSRLHGSAHSDCGYWQKCTQNSARVACQPD